MGLGKVGGCIPIPTNSMGGGRIICQRLEESPKLF